MITIHTEDVNRDGIIAILDRYFDAYTLIPAIGRWKGKAEASLIIQIADTGAHSARATDVVIRIADEIKALNNQEAVLITIDNVHSTVI